MWFELLILIIGVAYGFLHKGKEGYRHLLKSGSIIGIVLCIIFVLISMLTGIGLIMGLAGGIGLIGIIILVVIFLVGAFIGDFLEGIFRENRPEGRSLRPRTFFYIPFE